MIALIDADILPYEFGNMRQLENPDELLPFDITRHLVDERIQLILKATGSDSCKLYLTDSASNFRIKEATILPYKGNRPQEKPPQWEEVRQHLIDNWGAEVVRGMEADDALGIETCKQTEPMSVVLCSRDKDLHMIPGLHYSWPCGSQKENLWYINDLDSYKFFYTQLLTGDSTDNILGLYGVGKKSAAVLSVNQANSTAEMYEIVYTEYRKRFGSYADLFFKENARLLWILRSIEELENGPTMQG